MEIAEKFSVKDREEKIIRDIFITKMSDIEIKRNCKTAEPIQSFQTAISMEIGVTKQITPTR